MISTAFNQFCVNHYLTKEHHASQPSIHIKLIWGNGRTRTLNILQPVLNRNSPAVFTPPPYDICMIWDTDKPTHFIWHDPDARPVTQKMRDWVADTFPQIFSQSNKLLLFASIGTAPLELREQLKDLFNEINT